MFGHIPAALIMSEARPPTFEPASIKGPVAAASKAAPRLLPVGIGACLKDPGVDWRLSHLRVLSLGGGAEGVEKFMEFEGLERLAGGG